MIPQWTSPKEKMPDVPVFLGISKYNPDVLVYRKYPQDPEYTHLWLNIRDDILWWMPVPEPPKEAT